MSASAGKVMPRPMGDYNALTEYKVLDIVIYNDRPYMAKQTTQGNLPTNTTYWMLLLDFPTEVDNAPTQNSNNLVKSGGVYDATADKIKTDGSNIRNYTMSSGDNPMSYVDTISKNAGDSQDVILTYTVGSSTPMPAECIAVQFSARIGAEDVWFFDDTSIPYIKYYVIFDAVSVSGSTITITGHLKTDSSAAISLTTVQLHFGSFIDGSGNILAGDYNAIDGYGNIVVGSKNDVKADQCLVSGGNNKISTGQNHGIIGNGNAISAINNSVVLGIDNVSGYSDQLVVGVLNSNKSTTLFEVGSGTYPNTRKNAFEVYQGGYISMNDGTDKYKFAKSGGADGFYDGSNNFHPFTGYKELVNNSVVLSTSADTTVTFSDASITADSTIEPFTSVYSIAPKDCVASAGQCVVTIPKQSTAQTIKVKIRIS